MSVQRGWDLGIMESINAWSLRILDLKVKFDKQLDKVRYKPGYKFRTEMYDHHQLYLIIVVDTPDTEHPEKMFHLEFARFLDEWCIMSMMDDPVLFQKIVFDHILEMEKHEAGEWFRFVEHRPFYPHLVTYPHMLAMENKSEAHDSGDGRQRGGQDDPGGGVTAPVGGGLKGAQHQG